MRNIALLSAAFLTLSASAAQPNDSLDARYYRLFAPVTFYHNVADKALALNSDATGKDAVADEVDATLLNVYLNRPDLVSATETELQETGTIREDIDQPIENQVTLVDKVEAPVIDLPEDAPDSVVVQKPKFWTYKGDGFLQFMQNYVSDNWYKGGESNYSMVGSLVLEANYDYDMLLNGTYPYMLKQRIVGDSGHLNNKKAAELIQKYASDRLKRLFFCHLSAHNNNPEIVKELFEEVKPSKTKVEVLPRLHPTLLIEL